MTAKKTSFCQTLGNLQHGDTVNQLDNLLTEALQASNDTGKVSKVSLTLTIKPNGRGTYKILDDVKSTLPKFDREPTVLFTDGDQQLVREDPRQQKLKLEQVSQSGPVDLKAISADNKQTFKTLN
ncbi:hypothetical protein SLK20_01080 [Acinetobacter pittii]|uniref:hypothetical protein n=1 Tax=Acinetobacter pittii TaxID=48296 RepID=UPI002A08B417|nr:hypothetical protein [Acinetobacter pittii]MDX8157792.1 hypothetical protein [Acinetobacter pittii]